MMMEFTPPNQNKTNPEKPITHKEMTEMLAKAQADGALKKKGSIPKYLTEMDLVPYPSKFRQPKL